MFDQLNELACVELICRNMQMSEYRYRVRILIGPGNDEFQEDLHL